MVYVWFLFLMFYFNDLNLILSLSVCARVGVCQHNYMVFVWFLF